MAYSGLQSFVQQLEKENELIRIKVFTDPQLEIPEITDRIVKSGGKALLFENTGKQFPLLINAFGSDKRIALAFGRKNPYDAGNELEDIFHSLPGNPGGLFGKISHIPDIIKFSSLFPQKISSKGECQDVVIRDPDLGILPVLKCWPHDGGPFITLPMVHTVHPETGSTNTGMYRMQVLGKSITGMHWHRHKTGANHFEAWKKTGKKMPVSVALGGDPVYTYASTAPLPENINEYLLAGFLRKKKVKLVKCLTNELYVPADADFILEGFVDPAEEPVWEGPFGDHTGFYSLADWYPRFHVTCITHRKDAVYPATIVGVPPHEDAFLAKATERIFLSPVRIALLPEIEDFHMPDVGTAHNLVIVKIRKNYPGQGMKVINSLFGAGQMMFSKYIVVVSGDVNIRNYPELAEHVFRNFDPEYDVVFSRGPLDVLDHASEKPSFGGKAGFDATIKHLEEISGKHTKGVNAESNDALISHGIININTDLEAMGIPVLLVSIDCNPEVIQNIKTWLTNSYPVGRFKLAVAIDSSVDIKDYFTVAWQVLANSDPLRDHDYIANGCLFIDATIKAFRQGFSRKWPNVVCSDAGTVSLVDEKWHTYGTGDFIESPSLRYGKLLREGKDEITG